MFYYSKQVFTLEGTSKTMKCNSFIVQMGKPCLWELFYQSDRGTRSWWPGIFIHRNNSSYSYTFQYTFLWLWKNELLPPPPQLGILPYLTLLRKNQRNYGTTDSELSDSWVHLSSRSTWPLSPAVAPGPALGKVDLGRIHTSKTISSHGPSKVLSLEY